MKAMFLAAAAVIAMPAFAQTSGSTGTTTPTQTMNDPGMQMQTGDPSMQSQPMTDPAMQSPMANPQTQQPAPGQTSQSGTMYDPAMSTGTTNGSSMSGSTMSGSTMSGGSMSTGGYQPSQPPISGGMAQPGATVRFQAAPSPDQAYPAPAPLANYPVCKRGQYDKCIQRGGR